MRIGHGYDAHRLVENRKLTLGGVTIPYEKGLEGHSDADALIHALCDALLGAMGLGDIGTYFPDTDPQYKDIDSRVLLEQVVELMIKNNYVLFNADMTILAQAPKMAGHIPAMKENLSHDLKVNADKINIKATTTEKMGHIGRGEGIAVHSVVLLDNI
ncbi:MAG: 2-C-methyl-D-erythritol 2,4-cyclodiphosphate synthase [Proteobacteria bacterium]|nr:2-C-methyl-D-erythritol 2,4-cyclodiphosphate synthase [Pseudomonadota bacterium]